jgi:hypothetical protein
MRAALLLVLVLVLVLLQAPAVEVGAAQWREPPPDCLLAAALQSPRWSRRPTTR